MQCLGPFLSVEGFHAPGKPEVTDLDIALTVYQDIGWFQIPVCYVGRMQKVDATQQIV
jgi:hypothetical protein